MFETPVILLIFNRPDHTQKTFDVLRTIKPRRLFVVADGPRNAEEHVKCEAARAVATSVDWDCEIKTNLSGVNMGCRRRVASGLNWAFTHCEEAIILEDDCVANLSFFPFCQELLERYRHNSQVMAISGSNFQFGRSRTSASYYFSFYPHCWGWATWRSAWQCYDDTMSTWPQRRSSNWLKSLVNDRAMLNYYTKVYDQVFNGEIDSWAYRWQYSCWEREAVSVLPRVNLVENIGFGTEATHTTNVKYLTIPKCDSIAFPIQHPENIARNVQADRFDFYKMCVPHDRGISTRLFEKVRRVLRNCLKGSI